MSMKEYDSALDALEPIVDGCKDSWILKRSWKFENFRDIYEDLQERTRTLKALANTAKKLDLSPPQKIEIAEYIEAVRRVPGSLINKIEVYYHQRKTQTDLPEKKLFELYGYENPHEYNAKNHIALVGTNDISQALLKYIDLKIGRKTPEEIREEAFKKAKDWVFRLNAHERIEDKTAMSISDGHFAVLEMAATVLEVDNYDIRSRAVIGVPTGHTNTWRFMKDQRIYRLIEYSKKIYEEVEDGKFSFLRKFPRYRKVINPLDLLCGPDMSVIALREEVMRVISEIERIQKELQKETATKNTRYIG